MGRKFGAIGRLKNVVTYSLSPFEQRAFAGFQKSLANFVRRVRWQLPYQIPPVIIGVLIYNWGTNDFIRRNRKNPKDYENDVWTLFFNYLGFHYLFVTFCLIHSTVLGVHPQSPESVPYYPVVLKLICDTVLFAFYVLEFWMSGVFSKI